MQNNEEFKPEGQETEDTHFATQEAKITALLEEVASLQQQINKQEAALAQNELIVFALCQMLELQSTALQLESPESLIVEERIARKARHAYEEGNKFLQKSEFRAALPHLKCAADLGYSHAYLSLGNLYKQAATDAEHIAQSHHWFQKAAGSFEFFKAQAEKGDPDAQLSLGRCYQYGVGVEIDLLAAFHCFELAAKQGNAHAQCNVGGFYQKGEAGIEKNIVKAVQYWEQAATQGHIVAQCSLGRVYALGLGVKKNPQTALRYYQMAAGQGDRGALYDLGVLYMKGDDGIEENSQTAFHYFELAAEKGCIESKTAIQMLLMLNPSLQTVHATWSNSFSNALNPQNPRNPSPRARGDTEQTTPNQGLDK